MVLLSPLPSACQLLTLKFSIPLAVFVLRTPPFQCIISGTETNEQTTLERQKINYRRLSLTDLKIDIPRNATFTQTKTAFETADIVGKWTATSWAKKRAAKAKRASLSDFDRFKVVVLRKKKAAAIKAAQ